MKLSSNNLKVIAAIAMLSDHIGLMFFPHIKIFRIIGRLAFPIFAYFIAEGCRYTHNKLRYFLTVFLTGVFCQLVYFFADNSLYMCILITFSISILLIYQLQYVKSCAAQKKKRTIPAAFLLMVSIALVWVINTRVEIDYGFFGCMLPLLVSLFQPFSRTGTSSVFVNCSMLFAGLVILSINAGGIQFFSLLSVPVLLMYSRERGKVNMKYFFYVFYPLHLGILGLIDMIR